MTAADTLRENIAIDLKLAENKKKIEQNQSEKTTSQTQVGVPTPTGKQWWRADEAMTISATVLVFGLLVLVMMTFTLRKGGIHPDAVLKLFGTIIVVIGALFLIVAGYTDTQMGPVMGLLGTIAGYLLGKNSSQPVEKEAAQ
jgi:ABC-type xylose transport system permease subunit